MRFTRLLVALVMFGVGFGYVEAAVVVYLRAHYQPIRRAAFGEEVGDELFPMLNPGHLEEAGPQYLHMLWTELGRELATMMMLAAAGLASHRNVREWLAGFMIAFGVWDIFYYVFLRLLIGWPDSLLTWDILFLWPTVWVGPVISPVLVALSMIAAGVALLWREARQRPVRLAWFHWGMIMGGALIIVVAFCRDHLIAYYSGLKEPLADGLPERFHWALFLVGMGVGAAGFVLAFLKKQTSDGRPATGRQEG